jgi:hypothetical protein
MDKNYSLIFLILMLTSFLAIFFSCQSKSGETEYSKRVNKIIKLLNEDHSVNVDSCRTVYVLQTEKCNVCTEENLDGIFSDSAILSGNSIFVLSSFSEEVLAYLLKKSASHKFRIIINKGAKFEKYGLSFMKNIAIVICNREVISWKFL